MKKTSGHRADHSRGSALLIVLALLVLLTTLTVAFLSRSTLERQLSNASFSQGKVDLAGQGAIAAIISDLQQEIVAGSQTSGGTSLFPTGFYYPTSNLTAVPAVVVPSLTATTIVGTGMENLIKISKSGYSFWPSSSLTTASNYTATSAANYNANTVSSRAAAVSTTTASLNNRSVSSVRWNKPLLMNPINAVSSGGTDFTPPSAFTTAPPDWIYVARDGSNPTTTSNFSSYIYSPNSAPTTATGTTAGTNPVTQRYAYAIYDEGGTLDMNVAGSPIASASAVTYSANQPYKNALAYADLTQLPGINSLGATQQIAFVNAIVGWRNFASAGLANTNIFPNTYSFTGANATAFDTNIIFNVSGFLGVGGPALQNGPNFTGSQNQTDNAFASRQQLLQFFLQGLGQNSTFTSNVPLSTLVSVMPYLGTFSRGLSQPSYQPPPLNSTTGTTASPYTTSSTGRPAVLPAANGGNNAAGLDDKINPGFLSSSVMVTASYTRNDGSAAVIGEPLVKKRFALSRLAWLTYKGPSATRTIPTSNPGVNTTNYDMWLLVSQYSVPQSYLLQGTAANIQKYFGLDWDATNNRWKYDYHNSGGTPATGSSGAIMQLGSIAALGANAHDPDFFELLKASLNVGSLGRALTPSNSVPTSGGANDATHVYPPDYYYPFETSVDPQIIQIGANIIDQYQTSGYPVRIAFNNGALGNILREYVSVENYPYLYAIQTGVLPAKQPVTTGGTPPSGGSNPSQGTPPTGVTSDGIGVVTQWPIIWNPHDPNSSIGAVYPSKFRIVADQTDPDTLAAGTSDTVGQVPNAVTLMCYSNGSPNSNATSGSGTSGSTLDALFGTGSGTQGIDTSGASSTYHLASITNGTSNSGGTCSNSAIDLTVTNGNHSTMFHDPTVIMTARTLTFASGNQVSALLEATPTDPVIASVATTSGVTCVVANPTNSASIDGVSTNQSANARYLGFYLGAFPLVYKNKATPTPTPVYANSAYIATYNGGVGGTVVGTYVTYRMQYYDTILGRWVTYDTKYGCPLAGGVGVTDGSHPFSWGQNISAGALGTWSTYGQATDGSVFAGPPYNYSYNKPNDMVADNYTSVATDPRTHRFGMFTHYDQSGAYQTPWHDDFSQGSYYQCLLGQDNANGGQFTVNGTSTTNWSAYETCWLDTTNNIIASFRQDMMPGFWFEGPYMPYSNPTSASGIVTGYSNSGYSSASGWMQGVEPPEDNNATGAVWMRPGLLSQNCTQIVCSGARVIVDGQDNGQFAASDYYADPDGVVRRADAGYVPPGDSNSPNVAGTVGSPGSEYGTADTTMGLPMAQVGGWTGGVSAPSIGIFTQLNNSSHTTTATHTTAALDPSYNLTIPTPPVPNQNVSQPYILHRPFRSVGEMGYAFRDTPWKSISFDKPESGDSALLDVFTLNENNNPTGLEAGKVDLNTRQAAVVAALLSNAYLDDPETSTSSSTYTAAGATATTAVIGGPAALAIAKGIVSRTTDTTATDVTNGAGPFQNISELVGKWGNQLLSASKIAHPSGLSPAVSPANGLDNSSGFVDGMLAYIGFSGMPTSPAGTQVTQTVWTSATPNSSSLDTSANPNLMTLYTANSTSSTFGVFPTTLTSSTPAHAGLPEAMAYAKRYHEAPIRALVNGTQTRVWNLMIDVIAQTGRFPSSASTLANFYVEGERRYWVHVAIDRYTGKVLDEQVEEVKE